MDIGDAHSFAASVFVSPRVPLPCIPAPAAAPARRAALSVVVEVKISTPQANRIARHTCLRKKVRSLCTERVVSCLRVNVREY
jgi:large subunit ribosomal protein L18